MYKKQRHHFSNKGLYNQIYGFSIKNRNSKNLTESEEIKKRQWAYTELYKKGFNDPDNHDEVTTQVGLKKYYYEQN